MIKHKCLNSRFFFELGDTLMKKRITFVIIVLLGLLNNVFVNSSTIVVDVEITFNTLTLNKTGDGIYKGEIWFKITNSYGMILYDEYFGKKAKGTYDNIGLSADLDKNFPQDSLFIEVWDADSGEDDLLFKGELYIKNSAPRTIEYLDMQDNYWTYYSIFDNDWHLISWPDDRTYAKFSIYGCTDDEGWVWDYDNNLSIDVNLRYYYFNII